MWIALLLLSWCVEGVVGIWFCAHYWLFTQFRYDGNATVLGPGYTIIQIYNGFISTWDQAYHLHRHPFVLTQSRLTLLLVAVYVALHALALVRGLVAPYRERRKLGVRRHPTVREIHRLHYLYASLPQPHAPLPHAPPHNPPL